MSLSTSTLTPPRAAVDDLTLRQDVRHALWDASRPLVVARDSSESTNEFIESHLLELLQEDNRNAAAILFCPEEEAGVLNSLSEALQALIPNLNAELLQSCPADKWSLILRTTLLECEDPDRHRVLIVEEFETVLDSLGSECESFSVILSQLAEVERISVVIGLESNRLKDTLNVRGLRPAVENGGVLKNLPNPSEENRLPLNSLRKLDSQKPKVAVKHRLEDSIVEVSSVAAAFGARRLLLASAGIATAAAAVVAGVSWLSSQPPSVIDGPIVANDAAKPEAVQQVEVVVPEVAQIPQDSPPQIADPPPQVIQVVEFEPSEPEPGSLVDLVAPPPALTPVSRASASAPGIDLQVAPESSAAAEPDLDFQQAPGEFDREESPPPVLEVAALSEDATPSLPTEEALEPGEQAEPEPERPTSPSLSPIDLVLIAAGQIDDDVKGRIQGVLSARKADGSDVSEVEAWLAGANQEDCHFGTSIGQLLSQREDTQPLAAEWFQFATDQGCQIGEANLGLAKVLGIGVDQNVDEGRIHLLNARNAEIGEAAWALGMLSLGGIETEKDPGLGSRFLNVAVDFETPAAYGELGRLHELGIGMEPNLDWAFHLYRKGADAGDTLSMQRLAAFYREGFGVVSPDQEKAADFDQLHANAPEPNLFVKTLRARVDL